MELHLWAPQRPRLMMMALRGGEEVCCSCASAPRVVAYGDTVTCLRLLLVMLWPMLVITLYLMMLIFTVLPALWLILVDWDGVCHVVACPGSHVVVARATYCAFGGDTLTCLLLLLLRLWCILVLPHASYHQRMYCLHRINGRINLNIQITHNNIVLLYTVLYNNILVWLEVLLHVVHDGSLSFSSSCCCCSCSTSSN